MDYIPGGRRCALRRSEWIPDWWVGTSPRNGDDAQVEGTWEDWVALARRILEADLQRARDVEYVSCPTHCCPVHGCKYGYEMCPVATRAIEPEDPHNNGCEMCEGTREEAEVVHPAGAS